MRALSALVLLLAAAVLLADHPGVHGCRQLRVTPGSSGRELAAFGRALKTTTGHLLTTTFEQQIGSSNEIIDVTIEYCADLNNDANKFNEIRVTLAVDAASLVRSGTEDMIGVAFHFNGNATLFSSLSVTDITTNISAFATVALSTFVPLAYIAQDRISDNNNCADCTDPGFMIAGDDRVKEPYDIGIKFSDEGLGVGQDGGGIVQIASFILSSSIADLNATAVLGNTSWYVRLQSTDGGGESAKMGGLIPETSFLECGPEGADLNPAIAIVKVTNGADGLEILVGSTVTWTYTVTNTGNVPLSNVAVTDDKLGPITSYTGDTNNDGKLDTSEIWVYTTTGNAVAGNYTNTGAATGQYNGVWYSASDGSSYFGAAKFKFKFLRISRKELPCVS